MSATILQNVSQLAGSVSTSDWKSLSQTAYSPPTSVVPEQLLNGGVPFNLPCLGTTSLKKMFNVFDRALHPPNCIAHAVVHGGDAMGVTPIVTASRVRPAYTKRREADLLNRDTERQVLNLCLSQRRSLLWSANSLLGDTTLTVCRNG